MRLIVALVTVAIRREHDILLVRQRGRQISLFLGFSTVDVVRITTALSEMARNAFEYGGGGTVAFAIETQAADRQELVIRVQDNGPGIVNVAEILAPTFKSRTGMGIGIKGSRSLMDRFAITSVVGKGTMVVMAKFLPWSASKFGPTDAARLSTELAKSSESTPFGELQVQNQALLTALQELTERQEEVTRLSVVAEEERLRSEAARRVAERSLVVRERFMALTTHEFRTPLNAILGYLDLLDMEIAESITDTQKDYFGRVQRACKHLVGVTNDFLDMAKGDAGHLSVARREESARQVMSEAAALVAPQAGARNVTVNLIETAEHLRYVGDVDRVRQVLVNLIGNAVSFSPTDGVIEVTASRGAKDATHPTLSDGSWCTIRVTDTGPGIPADKLEHVFEPFVQLSTDGQASRKGSGLGLTVSRQLALLMGGELTVSSSGSGATFTLWLLEGGVREGAVPSPAGDLLTDAVS
ncbi:ATP-binding protein [soil metagenome]